MVICLVFRAFEFLDITGNCERPNSNVSRAYSRIGRLGTRNALRRTIEIRPVRVVAYAETDHSGVGGDYSILVANGPRISTRFGVLPVLETHPNSMCSVL